MPIAVNVERGDRLLTITASGIMDVLDVRRLDAFLSAAAEIGSFRFLFDATSFEGITEAAKSEEFWMRSRHPRHIERIAMVAPVKWHGDFVVLHDHLMGIDVRMFMPRDRKTALAWLSEGI